MDPNDALHKSPGDGLKFDPEHIDAADLNEQIRTAAGPGPAPVPPAAPAASVPPAPALKSRAKGWAHRLLVPFFPLLRLLALPLHEDVVRIDQTIDATNRRIDETIRALGRSAEYIKILHVLNHNLVVELTKLRIEHDALKSKVRLQEKELEFLTLRERAMERRVAP